MATSTYSPSDVSFKLYGIFDVTGFAADSFINIQKEGSRFSSVVGSQGDIARVHSSNDMYRVTLSLAQSSIWNQILIAIHELDESTLVGKFPLTVSDGSGDSLFTSSVSWIDTVPDVTYSNGMEVRDWSFTCSALSFNLGGNEESSELSQLIFTAIGLATSSVSGGIGAL